jgi:hypothetical protein
MILDELLQHFLFEFGVVLVWNHVEDVLPRRFLDRLFTRWALRRHFEAILLRAPLVKAPRYTLVVKFTEQFRHFGKDGFPARFHCSPPKHDQGAIPVVRDVEVTETNVSPRTPRLAGKLIVVAVDKPEVPVRTLLHRHARRS